MKQKQLKSKHAIKLIVIDLYGVMSLGSYRDTCEWLCKKYGFDYEYCYKIVYHKYFCQAATRKISEKQATDLTAKELGIKESGAELLAKHLSFQHLNKQVFKWALMRKQEGYKILLLSKNTPGQFRYAMKKFALANHFEATNTYYLNIDKKSPETARYILKKYKLRPDEVLMIDDQDFNLIHPQKIGLNIILYKNFIDFSKKAKSILKY
ncbi:MAG: HAD family hydrolase [Patescibacteria group bacterium]